MINNCFVTIVLKLIFISLFAIGCSTWGKRSKDAAMKALKDPVTIVGVGLGSLAMSTQIDDDLSQSWARRRPVFGRKTLVRSDQMRETLLWSVPVTALLVAPKEEPSQIALRFGTEISANVANSNVTDVMKDNIHRRRPHGRNDPDSFPSGHATDSFVNASLSVRNLEESTLPQPAIWISQAYVYALSTGVAITRVEGNVHYPSDVLFGAAIGNFMGVFFYNLFLGDQKTVGDYSLVISVIPPI